MQSAHNHQVGQQVVDASGRLEMLIGHQELRDRVVLESGQSVQQRSQRSEINDTHDWSEYCEARFSHARFVFCGPYVGWQEGDLQAGLQSMPGQQLIGHRRIVKVAVHPNGLVVRLKCRRSELQEVLSFDG